MEDRHSLSDPRPISDVPTATWEVDIFREGVDTPIMTILVNKTSLPPRKRKKKIVWKLPDTIAQTPKFGMEDKKRILDLYKQQKKIRRQRRSVQATGSGGAEGCALTAGDFQETTNKPPTITRSQSLAAPSSSPMNGVDTDNSKDGSNDRPAILRKSHSTTSNGGASSPKPPVSAPTTPPPGFSMASLSVSENGDDDNNQNKQKPSKENKHYRQPTEESTNVKTGDARPRPVTHNGNEKKNNGGGSAKSSSTRQGKAQEKPRQQNGTTPDSTQPPPSSLPGSDRQQSQQSSSPLDTNASPQTAGLQQQQQAPPPGLSQAAAPTAPSTAPGSSVPQQPLRHFVVPPTSTLAQIVTETYYLYLGRGLIHELAAHYAPTAQKSLTVGGAHAMCQQPTDIVMQLQRLSGMVVHVKGVLQHAPTPTSLQALQPQPPGNNSQQPPLPMNTSTLIVITGTCVQPHALPFCHSLVLVPSTLSGTDAATTPPIGGPNSPNDGCYGFQIQNDALCFLTPDDVPPLATPTA